MKKFEKMAKVAIVYKYEFCPLSFKTKIKYLDWKLSELLALEENPSHPSHHPQVPVLECSLSRTNNNTKQIFNHNFKLMMDFWDTAGIIIWDPQYFLRLISNWIYHQQGFYWFPITKIADFCWPHSNENCWLLKLQVLQKIMIHRQSIIFQRDIIVYGAQIFLANDLHHPLIAIPF